jgi:hypothetical protein
MIEKTPPLPVPEDMLFQQRVWAAERIGWVVLTIAVLAGLLGVFSDGLVSAATVTSGDGGLQVHYERFERKTARAQFAIRVLRAPSQETHLRLRPGFVESYVIESLYPQPVRSTAGAQGLELVFAPTGAGDLSVHLAARARRFGRVAIAVEVEGLGSVEFKQLIYP